MGLKELLEKVGRKGKKAIGFSAMGLAALGMCGFTSYKPESYKTESSTMEYMFNEPSQTLRSCRINYADHVEWSKNVVKPAFAVGIPDGDVAGLLPKKAYRDRRGRLHKRDAGILVLDMGREGILNLDGPKADFYVYTRIRSRYEVFVSNDKAHWSYVGKARGSSGFNISGKIKARYVKIKNIGKNSAYIDSVKEIGGCR